MYELYSPDARTFIVNTLKNTLDNPQSFAGLTPELKVKAQGLLVLELVSKFCEAAEDLGAFAISLASELYMNALSPEEVWKKLAEYETGDVVNFYAAIKKRRPEYFANLHGYPPLTLQANGTRANLFRSCRQLAAFLGRVAELYEDLRELHNAYKHGMRVFFGKLPDGTERGLMTFSFVDRNAIVKAIPIPHGIVDELPMRCDELGQLLGASLRWHKFRMDITKTRRLGVTLPIFGQSTTDRVLKEPIIFPALFDIRKAIGMRAEAIATKKKHEVSKIPAGHVIAIDIDEEEILPNSGPDLREVILKAMKDRPAARLAFRRIAADGKVGPY